MPSRDSVGIFDLNITEINAELSPFSYLIEACKALDSLKSQIRDQNEIENEFLKIIKSMKHGIDKVFSCSHTL